MSDPEASVVEEDYAAEEAYVQLQRERSLTAPQLAAQGIVSERDAQAGLDALVTAGRAVVADSGTYTLAEDGPSEESVSTPVEIPVGAEERPPPGPLAASEGVTVPPALLLRLAAGAKVRMRVEAVVEMEGGGMPSVVEVISVISIFEPES